MTYTEKELNQFLHGISLSLLSKKSAQHWRYDEETAKEIEWLEALERKVRADKADRKTEPSIDIIRCKDCDNYAGEGMYCAWNVLTGDMGYCHHARPKGSTDITAEQTEPTCSKMEQVDKDINVLSKTEPQNCDTCRHHFGKDYYDIECEAKAFGNECKFEPKDEPQTITMVKDHGRKQALEMIDLYHKLKDEPQTNADQHVQHVGSVESVEPTWTKEEHEAFYTFLWNVINPNEMQDYIEMFETKDEPQTERSE